MGATDWPAQATELGLNLQRGSETDGGGCGCVEEVVLDSNQRVKCIVLLSKGIARLSMALFLRREAPPMWIDSGVRM